MNTETGNRKQSVTLLTRSLPHADDFVADKFYIFPEIAEVGGACK
jgi:hypothetical protein